MSIDFDCYLARKPIFKPKNIEGNDWQIAVNGPMLFEPEDIDPEISAKIGKRLWLFQIHLEGQSSEDGLQKLEALFRKLIKKHDACVYDPQQDLVITRNGQQSIIRTEVEVKIEKTASLTFYFDQRIDFTKTQRLRFYELVETIIPKALPRRYGSYEPLQFKLAEQGKEHFLQLWHDDTLGIIWRGSAPYQWMSTHTYNLDDDSSIPVMRRGKFVCSVFDLGFSSKLLKTKKDLFEVVKFQAEVSKLLKVFYSEIRLGNQFCYNDWRGLPSDSPLTACLGEPYLNLWADFKDDSDKLDKKLYMKNYIVAEQEMPKPPEDLIAPQIPEENPLNTAPSVAKIFPFDIPKRPKGIPERYKA